MLDIISNSVCPVRHSIVGQVHVICAAYNGSIGCRFSRQEMLSWRAEADCFLLGYCCCRPDGQKKAYVRLAPDHDALDVANKIGII